MKHLKYLIATFILAFIFSIEVNAQFITLTTSVNNIKCPGDSTGSVIVFAHKSSVASITLPLTFQINGPVTPAPVKINDTTAVFSGLPEGNYVISVTDKTPAPNNKIGFAAIAIGGITPLESNPSTKPVSCVGLSDGEAIVSTTGGTPPYSYAWAGLSDTDSIANDVIAGTYSVIITDNNKCKVFDTLTVEEGDTLEAKFSVSPACQGVGILITDQSVGIDGSTSYNWNFGTGASPSNSSTAGNQNISYTSSGNKTISLTLDNGTCTHTLNVNNQIFALPTLTTSGDVAICETDTTALTVTGAISYTWLPTDSLSSPSSSSTFANPSSTTTYTVTGTNANNCTNTASVTITVNPLPNIILTPFPDTTLCENNAAQLQASGGNTYTWSPSTGLSSTTIPNPIASPLTNQTYKVVASSGANCKDSTTVTVNIIPAPVITISPNDSICIGSSKNLTVSGGATYDWFPKDGSLNNTSSPTPIASPIVTTTYTAVVTGANGCIDSAKVTIKVNPLPITTISSKDTICENVSKQLTATGGINYAWTPNNGSLSSTNIANPIARPKTTTFYYVNITDNKGCIKKDSVEIVVQPIPVATISPSPDTAICIGESVTLTANGGSNYSWIPGGQTATSINVTPATTQTFKVVASNGFNCTDTASVEVIINPLPTIVITTTPNDSICLGDSTQLTATGGINYSWAPTTGLTNATSNSTFAKPATNTTYTVTVTDDNNCTNTADQTIRVLTLPSSSASPDDTICIGQTSNLTISGGTSYSWTPSSSLSDATSDNPIASPTTTTQYIVAIKDNIGCTNFDTINIIVNPLPIITTSSDKEICLNDTTQLTVSGANTYIWTPASTLDNSTSTTPNATPTTTTNYIVTATDLNNCVAKDSILITVNPLPNLSVTPQNDTICKKESTNISVSGAQSYVWSPDSTLNTNIGSTVTASPLTDHIYTIVGTDTKGCKNSTTATVLIEPVITIDIVENDTICQGDTVLLDATVTNGVSYAWTSNTDIIGNPNQRTTQAIPQTTQWFKLEVTNIANCTNQDSLLVVVETAPTLNLSVTADSICAGDSTLLVASGNGVKYTWSSTSAFSTNDSVYVTPLTTTTYNVVSETVGGCTKTADTTIFVDPVPVAGSTTDRDICIGDTIKLIATGGVSYVWSPNEEISNLTNDTVSVSPLTTKTYTVQVFNSVGCSDISNTTITVNALPQVTIDGDTSICIGETTALTATSLTAIKYTWTPIIGLSSTNTATTNATPTNTRTYTVQVEDANGCKKTDIATVTVNQLPVIITSSDAILCEGENTTLTASGGTKYSWTPITGLSSPNTSSSVATPLTTTTYTVEVESAQGCKNNETVLVTVNPAPTGTITLSADTVCYGTEITATATLNGSFTPNPFGAFSFDGGATFTSINELSFTQTTPGDTTISIIFKDQFNCNVSAAVSITAHTLPKLTMEIDTIVLPDCTPPPGEFRVFNLAGGLPPYTIGLNSGTPVATTDTTYKNLSPGIYTVNVGDAFGCAITNQLNFLSSITFDTTIVHPKCNGELTGSISISNVQGGVEPYTFSTDNQVSFSTNSNFTGLGDGLHTVFLKDNGNCLIELNFNLTEPTLLKLTALNTTNIICAGTNTGQFSLGVSGGVKPYTASNGSSSSAGNGPFTFFNLAAGNGTITITDGNSCSSTSNYAIKDAQEIAAFFTEVSPPSGCNTADGIVNLDSTINGSGNYSYSIDGGASFKSETSFKTDLTKLTSGLYNVIIKDIVLGCTDSSKFTLKTASGINLDSIKIDTIRPSCVGNDGKIGLTNVFGAPLPYLYELRKVPTDTILIPFQPDSTLAGIAQGDYSVIIQDGLGCNYRLPVFMPGPQILDFTTQVNHAKCGREDGQISITATGGSGAYVYTLDTLAQTFNVFDSLAAQTYNITVRDTTDSTCTISKPVIVLTNAIDVVLDIDSVSCFGVNDGKMTIINLLNTDSTNFTYEFGLDTTNISETNLSYVNLKNGLHTLWIKQTDKTTNSSCFYTDWETYINETIDDVYYDTTSIPNFFIGTPTIMSATTTTLPSDKDEANGTIFINNVNGGTAPYLYKIKEEASYFSYNNLDTVRNGVSGIAEGIYTVFVKDANGCIEPIEATVGRKLYIPNIFTPNNDNKNDFFYISNLPADNHLKVYDRWGILSYKMRGYDNSWDGKNQPDGIYYYELDTPTETHKGWVQIVRN